MTTNTHPDLPPMPEPFAHVGKFLDDSTAVFTENQMRAYALLCRNAALEEAYGGDHFDTQPRGAPFNPLNHEQTK